MRRDYYYYYYNAYQHIYPYYRLAKILLITSITWMEENLSIVNKQQKYIT